MSEPKIIRDAPRPDRAHDDEIDDPKKLRARRAFEKYTALRGTIHLKLDIDELRGRNRR